MAVQAPIGSTTTGSTSSFSSSRRSLTPHRLNASHGRSAARVLGEKADCYTLESFGVALPLEFKLVMKRDNCVHLAASGWAIGVDGTKVLLCPLMSSSSFKMSECVVLRVPSGPVWTADLVSVYSGPTSTCVVCVSRGGDVVFWPELSTTQHMTQTEIELATNDTVKGICPVSDGFMASTERHLFMLTFDKNGLSVKQLEEGSQGVLSYVSKRVSSIFFRGPSEQKLLQAFTCASADDHVIILYEKLVQKRLVDCSESKVVFTWDTAGPIREAVATVIAETAEEVGLVCEGLLWCVRGVCECGIRLVFLVGVVSPLGEDVIQMYLVVAKQPELDEGTKPSMEVEKVVDLSLSISEEGELSDLLEAYSLVTTSSPDHVAVVGTSTLHLCQVTADSPTLFVVDLRSYTPLKACGCVNGQCLLLSESCGLMAFVPSSVAVDTTQDKRSSMTRGVARTPKSFFGTPLQAKHNTKETEVVKRSFSLFCEQKVEEAIDVCHKAGVYDSFKQRCDSHGDSAVVRLSEAIVDDFPAADPRWAETTSIEGMSGRGSVIIQYQLEDKQFAHDKYLMYLSEMKMMERMSSVTVRKAPLRTWVVLSEHGEKLSATIALKELHRTLTPLEKNGLTVVDACIKRVLAARKLSVKNTKLTEQDLFYREVSSVDDIFWAMKDYIAEQWQLLGNNKTSQQWVLYGTTSVVKEMLGSAISYRGRHLRFYENVVGITSVWTFDASVKGVRSAVYAIIAKVFSDIPVDGDVNQQLWMLAADITDLVLSEYLQLLTVVEDERERAGLEDEFRRERSMWIQPFVAAHQLKMAAELAEKYKDFRTLVEVCDVSRNRDQLSKFVDQYHKEGFHKVLYSYYIEKGKYSLLFDQPLDHADLFTNYLVTHGNPNLQWVNGVNTRDYETSTAALNTLAADEELLPKKKTLLSLAKLCSLLKKDNEEKGQVMGALDQELRCVALQEKIPAKILRANGIDPQAPKVLSTEDIIDCYTKPYKGLTLEENLQLFMCALDLANLHNQVDSTAAHQLKVFIWVRAILKDSVRWGHLSTTDHVKSLQTTFFFQLVEAIFNVLVSQQLDSSAIREGLFAYLVDLKELEEDEEIADLKADTTFLSLLHAGYEHINTFLSRLS